MDMSNNNTYHFEKLTPINNSDISIYEKAIDFVFENDDIKNVAISGAYGAGKSSVLASYKAKHKEKKFLHISLAHFQSSCSSNTPTNTSNTTSVLEGKILNQMIHQITAKNIPQTNFKIKRSNGKSSIIYNTIISALFLLSLLHILGFSSWSQWVSSLSDSTIYTLLTPLTTNKSLLVSGIICLTTICFGIYYVLLLQHNKNIFKKITLHGNEIEIFGESNESYFDKYLNEVLYLFENIDENIIVFEDIDRFAVTTIFERLHEINTLINSRRTKENKPIIRFFYLIRDDIFTSKDRTKFFDYIIPVIPVVDSSNSYDQLINHLKKNDLLENFDEGFLQTLSLYIDDMRLLKNICNEFVIYYNRLNITELNHNKMLAIITYKNLFPKDFNDLQLNKGFVYALFDNKLYFADKIINDPTAKINQVKHQLEVSDTHSEIHTEKITAYQTEIQRLKSAPLASIITRDNIDDIFNLTTTNAISDKNEFVEIKESDYFPLIKFLIRNGHIDETYADYMTYFYENSISRIDKIFLRSITDKKAKPYRYELHSPEAIFTRLKPTDFDQEETLNFMLCDYLLSAKNESEHMLHFIAQLRNSQNYAFISQYFSHTKQLPLFIQVFNKHWSSMFSDIQLANAFDSEQLHSFSVCLLQFLDSTTIDKVNENAALTEYINTSKDYLDIESPQVDKLISAFDQLNICFTKIDYKLSNKVLLQAVYENDFYELNFENISMFAKNIWQIDSLDEIAHKNYTIISSDKNTPLYNRINKNITDYVNIILQGCDETILDDEIAAIELLNRDDIDKTQKITYINYLKTTLHNLSDVTDRSLWKTLLCTEILPHSEQNVLAYFLTTNKLDSTLIDFINNSGHHLNFSSSNIEITDEQVELLFDEIIECNDIADNQYTSILVSIGYYYDTFNIPNIQESKIQILINNNIIRMNSDNLEYIRAQYPTVLFDFVKINIEEYANIMNDDLFEQAELNKILSWDISDNIKLKLLGYSDKPISVNGKDYSTPICAYILTHNLDQSDMPPLYLSYNEQPNEIQSIIYKNASNNIDEIISDPQIAALSLREKIIFDKNIAFKDRINLFIAMIQYIDQEKACAYLSALNLNEFIKIFDRNKRPQFKINEHNEDILYAFRQKGWILEYSINTHRPGYFRIKR